MAAAKSKKEIAFKPEKGKKYVELRKGLCHACTFGFEVATRRFASWRLRAAPGS